MISSVNVNKSVNWSHLLKKWLMEDFIYFVVYDGEYWP